MRDVELYRALLGLTAPWTVAGVDVDLKGQRVVVRVDAGAGPYPCPECGTAGPRYDSKARRWRHLDTMQFTTWIEADVPRITCETHGVKQVRVPWAEPGSQFTALFERLAIDLLRECSITGAGRLLRISWDEGWGIKARAVKRGLARRGQAVVARLGVDEKAIAKRHRYLTIVADLEQSRVLYVADDRKQTSLDGFWPTLTPAQRDGITAVAMDMWEPYVQSTRAHLPEADGKIVFDKFHVVKHLHEAVDRVRRGEHRALKREGDERLTGSKYLWLRRPADLSAEQRLVLRALQREDFKVGRAWALKERFRTFWEYRYSGGGADVLHAVVLAGHPQPAEADGGRRQADPAASAEPAHLPAPPAHQCRARGRQRRHPVGEEDGPRVPQRRALQDGHLLPLRWPRSLPTRFPVEPFLLG